MKDATTTDEVPAAAPVTKVKRKRKTRVTIAESLKAMGGSVRILSRKYGFQEVLYSVLWTNPDLQAIALRIMKEQDDWESYEMAIRPEPVPIPLPLPVPLGEEGEALPKLPLPGITPQATPLGPVGTGKHSFSAVPPLPATTPLPPGAAGEAAGAGGAGDSKESAADLRNLLGPELLPCRYQATNHFPGMRSMCSKIHLTRHINRLKSLFPEKFSFYPDSWDLSDPAALQSFQEHLQQHEGQRTFILKPSMGLKGDGIALVQTVQQVTDYLAPRSTNNVIAQEYMETPLTMDGLKFDFRVYVCVASLNPFTAYVFHDGLARFATQAYAAPTPDNLSRAYMHLTNYSLNKYNADFKQTARPANIRRKPSVAAPATTEEVKAPDPMDPASSSSSRSSPSSSSSSSSSGRASDVNEERASKRSIQTTLRQLQQGGERDPMCTPKRFFKEVDDVCGKVLLAILAPLWRRYTSMFGFKHQSSLAQLSSAATAQNHVSKCFQIIGVDLMLAVPPAHMQAAKSPKGNKGLKMFLLELNQNPSFLCSQSEVDYRIKQGVLGQSLELMGILNAPFPAQQGKTPFEYTRLHPYNKYGYMLEAVARAQAKYTAKP